MIGLREFSWRYFTLTGDIDAYLLYKSHQELAKDSDDAAGEADRNDTSME
jgi:hypothetical protein